MNFVTFWSYLLLTWVSGAFTWDNMPGMLTLFLWRYFRKTSALRRANVQACNYAQWEQMSPTGSTTVSLWLIKSWKRSIFLLFVTLRKASFCSRCLLIIGVTWSDSLFGPSLSAPPHQSSSLLYSCSRLSSTLHTWVIEHTEHNETVHNTSITFLSYV